MSNRFLSGPQPQGSVGGNVPFLHFADRDPNQYDSRNYFLLDQWLNTTTSTVWILVSLQGTSMSKGQLATWIKFGAGDVQTLTSNTGGPVGPDGAFNINVVGDGVTITGVGNPATHTITLSVIKATGVVETLTGNSGGPVSPTAGNINVVGDTTTINIVGNPGTSTLTASTAGTVATSFPTDSGTAVPAAGALNIIANNAATHCGSSVEFTGAGNTVTLNVTDAGGNVLIGLSAGNLTLSGTANTGLGFNAGHALTSGSNNTFVGDLAGQSVTTGLSNTALGKSTLNSLTTGSNNTVIGQGSATALITGAANIILGEASGNALTSSESGNTLIGSAGQVGVSNQIIIALGSGGNRWVHNVGGTFVGNLSGNLAYSGTGGMTGLGENALNAATTATDCTIVGQQAGAMITTGSSNTIVGKDAGHLITTGQDNTIIGTSAAFNGIATGLLTGGSNIIIGFGTGVGYTGAESNNIIIGTSLGGKVGASGEIRIGNVGSPGNNQNIFIGNASGNDTYTLPTNGQNIAVGGQALASLTTSFYNTAMGQGALQSLTSGVGGNVMIGNAGGNLITTGVQNTGIGQDVYLNSGAGTGLITGQNNVAVGHLAGAAFTSSESWNIVMGNPGVIGDNATTRIGFGTTPQVKTFIDGIRGITTVNNDAVAVLIDSAGQLGVTSSSERYKENINDMGSASDDILNLRPVTFNYKNHSPESISYGLIAEEVDEWFPELVVRDKEGNPDTIKYQDLPVLLLNELIKLKKEIKALKRKK